MPGAELHVSADFARIALGRHAVRVPIEPDHVARRNRHALGRIRHGRGERGVQVFEETPEGALVQMCSREGILLLFFIAKS